MSHEQTLREAREFIGAINFFGDLGKTQSALLAKIDAALAAPAPDTLTAADYEQVLADHRRLVRELDVLLNGEAGAAKQASLCDIVSQLRAAPAAAAERPVARLHIRLEDDALAADVEVLNGARLQPEHSPVDVYLAPAPQPAEPRYSEDEIADALMMAEVSNSQSESVMLMLREPDEPTFTPGGGPPGDHNGEKATAPAATVPPAYAAAARAQALEEAAKLCESTYSEMDGLPLPCFDSAKDCAAAIRALAEGQG